MRNEARILRLIVIQSQLHTLASLPRSLPRFRLHNIRSISANLLNFLRLSFQRIILPIQRIPFGGLSGKLSMLYKPFRLYADHRPWQEESAAALSKALRDGESSVELWYPVAKGEVKRGEMKLSEFADWLIVQQDETDRLMEDNPKLD